jgi:hypothetical protein
VVVYREAKAIPVKSLKIGSGYRFRSLVEWWCTLKARSMRWKHLAELPRGKNVWFDGALDLAPLNKRYLQYLV